MTNNVSQVLHVIQKDLFGLNKTVDLATGKFNAMKFAAVGAMGVVGGAAVLGALGKVVAAGADVVHQQQLMKSAGMSNLEVAQATAQAWQTTSSVMGSAVVDNLKSIRELRIAFSSAAADSGGNPAAATAQALKYLPLMTQAQMILGSTLGNGAQDQVYDYAKGLEMIGATQNSDRFSTLLDGMVKAAEASGGKVTGAGFFSAIKYGRSAALGWNNNFITDVLPLLIQEYGSGSGAGGPGNALMSAYQAVVGGVMGNKGAEEFYKLGLLDPKSIIHTTTGSIKGVRPGGVKGSSEFIDNPYAWVQDILMPALKKSGITSEQDIHTAIASLFTNRTAQSMILAFATQQARFQGSADLTNQATGIGAWAGLLNGDLVSNFNAFTTSLGNLFKALGTPLVPVANGYLHDLTTHINELVLWVSKHPDASRRFGEMAAAVAAIVTGLGALAVTVAAGGALMLAFSPAGALVLGIAAVGVGLSALTVQFNGIPGALLAAEKSLQTFIYDLLHPTQWLMPPADALPSAHPGMHMQVVGKGITWVPDNPSAPPSPPPGAHGSWRPLESAVTDAYKSVSDWINQGAPVTVTNPTTDVNATVTNPRDIAAGAARHLKQQLSLPNYGASGNNLRATPSGSAALTARASGQ